jgi:hypothetical protein
MSKEQTFRSEDNVLLPLRMRRLSVPSITALSKMKRRAKRQKKTLKLSTPVSSLLQICPSLTCSCGIRDSSAINGAALEKISPESLCLS